MNKRIICMLISAIFLVTMFSSMNNICKSELVSRLSDKEDTLFENKIGLKPLPMSGPHFSISFGDFYVEDDRVIGHANLMIESSYPYFILDEDIDLAIHHSQYDVWRVINTNHIVIHFYIVPV